MAVIYNAGEKNLRPGVYMRIVNIGDDAANAAASAPVAPAPPQPSKICLLKDSRGVLFKTSDGYYLAVKN